MKPAREDPPPYGTGFSAKPAAPSGVSPHRTSGDYPHGTVCDRVERGEDRRRIGEREGEREREREIESYSTRIK